jgi:hypothetical protein
MAIANREIVIVRQREWKWPLATLRCLQVAPVISSMSVPPNCSRPYRIVPHSRSPAASEQIVFGYGATWVWPGVLLWCSILAPAARVGGDPKSDTEVNDQTLRLPTRTVPAFAKTPFRACPPGTPWQFLAVTRRHLALPVA